MPVPHLTLKVEDVYMQYVSWGNTEKPSHGSQSREPRLP